MSGVQVPGHPTEHGDYEQSHRTQIMEMISVKDLPSVKYEQLPVITTDLLAQLYGTTAHSITKNHRSNADRFIAGKHYYKVVGEELATLRVTFGDLQISPKARSLILWTERGAARHAKMLETDQAWEVFEKLEDCYFSCKPSEAPQPSHSYIPQRFLLTLSEGKWFTEPAPVDSFIATPDTLAKRIKAESYMFDRTSLVQVMQTCLALL
jgi:hypothetical protein